MSFKSGVKGGGSDRWWERRRWLWWGDMRRMRWTRRRVNTMRLTEWRRELIPQVRWCISAYPTLPRFRDIRAFARRKPLFHTPPLFRTKFRSVPFRVDPCYGLQGEESWNYSVIKLYSKYSDLRDHDTPTLQTDGRTDGRLAAAMPCSAYRDNVQQTWIAPVGAYRRARLNHQMLHRLSYICGLQWKSINSPSFTR